MHGFVDRKRVRGVRCSGCVGLWTGRERGVCGVVSTCVCRQEESEVCEVDAWVCGQEESEGCVM